MKRKGISPISAVLVLLATVVSAGVVAWFFFVSTRSATNQPLVEVTDAYATGTTVTLTVRNIGSVDLVNPSFPQSGTCGASITLSSCSVAVGNLMRGSSAVIKCTASATPTDGTICTLPLQATNQQTGQPVGLTLSFRVVTP